MRIMKNFFKATVFLIGILILHPVALAESDYETGDGWVFRDGTLTITQNGGLKDFEFYEHNPQTGEWTRSHTVDDVKTLIIGKNVTELSIEMYDWKILNPSSILIENGNSSFVNIDGWIVNTKTNTLFGASNMAQTRTMKTIDNIPSSIEHIGARAFSYFQELQQIQLPQSIVSIGERAFENCDSLSSLVLPDSLTSIGDIAFDDCDALSYIKLDANIEQIGCSTFNSCESLEDVNLDDTKIQALPAISFGSCDQLKLLRLPATITKIESQALNGCQQLNTVMITSNDIVIENSAFGYCDSLQKIFFSKGTPGFIGKSLFSETDKTPDGKSYISSSSERRGETIPYPTLYYTAAYADEWAPNGETEWNGYTIQQISQEELDAILAEARGEESPMLTGTPAQTASATTAPEPTATSPDKNEPDQANSPMVEILLLSAIAAVAAGIAVFAWLRKRKTTK